MSHSSLFSESQRPLVTLRVQDRAASLGLVVSNW